jgi:hypothetical protein
VNRTFFRAFHWVKITRLSSNQSLRGFFFCKKRKILSTLKTVWIFCLKDFAMIFSIRLFKNTLTSRTVQSVKSYDISVTKFQNHYIHCLSRNKQLLLFEQLITLRELYVCLTSLQVASLESCWAFSEYCSC